MCGYQQSGNSREWELRVFTDFLEIKVVPGSSA